MFRKFILIGLMCLSTNVMADWQLKKCDASGCKLLFSRVFENKSYCKRAASALERVSDATYICTYIESTCPGGE